MKTFKIYTLRAPRPAFVLILAAALWIGCKEDEDEVDANTILMDATTLEDVYYHQINYDRPTILIYRNLTTATNSVYFHQCVNIKEVRFPNLVSIGDENAINPYFYFHQNEGLEKVEAPKLKAVYGYVYFHGNLSLDLSSGICGIADIYTRGDPDEFSCLDPYVEISGNANNVKCFTETLHLCN
jgi:hypothetical protein